MPVRWNAFKTRLDAPEVSRNHGTFVTRRAAREALLSGLWWDAAYLVRGSDTALTFFLDHPRANEFVVDGVKYSIQKVTTSYLP